MPQYKLTQYGLSQYGIYQSDPTPGTLHHWQLIRSRLGARWKDGTLVWVYQHTPAVVKGNPQQIRLKSNTGETIRLASQSIKGRYARVRVSTPGEYPVNGISITQKGRGSIGLPQ